MKGEREQEPPQELPWWYWPAGILVAVIVAAVVVNYDKLNLPKVFPRGLVEAFKQGQGIASQADPCSPLAEQQIRDHCQFAQGSMYHGTAIKAISYQTMAICESDEHDALVILRNERGCSRD